jgi:hypothetical protein
MSQVTAVPQYLESLAKQQDRAAGDIESGTEAAAGTGKKLWYDHGVVFGQTASALQACESERKKTGDTMKEVSEALAENLRTAAAKYQATDEQASEVIDQQVLPR